MLNTINFGFCTDKEINSFRHNGVSLSSTIRRTCTVPPDRLDSVWSKEQINESFERFSLKFSSLRSNGCGILNSFTMEREVESDFFFLLFNLRLVAQKNVSFSIVGKNEIATANPDVDLDIFEMLCIVRSGLVCVNMPLIESFCNGLCCPKSMIPDTRSECMCSLIKSVELFNPFKCNKFSTYAYTAFSNTFLDALRIRKSQSKLINSFVDKVVRSNLHGIIVEPKMNDIESRVSDIIETIRQNPSSLGLTEIETKCVFYILDDNNKNLNEKGISLGISRRTLKNRTISALNKIKSNIIGTIGIR